MKAAQERTARFAEEQAVRRRVALPSPLVRRLAVDKAAALVVAASGLFVVLSICAMVVVIALEFLPLLSRPRLELTGTAPSGETSSAGAVAVGADEYRSMAYVADSAGGIRFIRLEDRSVLRSEAAVPPLPPGQSYLFAQADRFSFLFASPEGALYPVELTLQPVYEAGKRTITPAIEAGPPSFIPEMNGRRLLRLAYGGEKNGRIIAAQAGERELFVQHVRQKRALIGGGKTTVETSALTAPTQGTVSALAVSPDGEVLIAGTDRGEIFTVNLTAENQAAVLKRENFSHQASAGFGIERLCLLLGEQTLIAGGSRGEIQSLLVRRDYRSQLFTLTPHSRFAKHGASTAAIAASPRNKSFISADRKGGLKLHYATSGETLLELNTRSPVRLIDFAPKGDGLLAIDSSGTLFSWSLHNPHPEVTLRTLFGKVWYEGRNGPEYVWQSSGASDEFEAKLSLVPLIFGTLKGTFYALLFAVPLSVLAALYVSQFMHPSLRSIIKPAVELLAALPSVVVGFIAGLWLAPRVEKHLLGLFLAPAAVLISVLTALLVWTVFQKLLSAPLRQGAELLFLLLAVSAGLWLSFRLGGVLESTVFAGDFISFMRERAGAIYDQRNSIVVGVAMGFAVIPIIFTITEDCLSAVPRGLIAASLALGATKWQTAVRVVLPTASPGVFSAIMIGFGRAVGETMIVLMATGNTPLLDWSAFNGFRALSANIAVELPEAPHGGTLYRVLFLSAFLLFITTFVVNMISEAVRLRLRKRYQVT